MSTVYATPDDYRARGHDTGPWDLQTLNVKLGEASRLLRARVPGLDQKVADGALDEALLTDIACAMVSRAVPVADVPMGAESTQLGVDIFQQTVRFGAGGAAAIYISKGERKTLGIGGSRIMSVDPIVNQG